MIELGLKFTLGYLLGGVLGSLVVGWFRGGVDIRKLGSGNAGGTNALRTQGKWFALWVMVIDIGKGIVAAIVIPPLALPGIAPDPDLDPELIVYAVAFAAVVGHVFPVWFGFRGGKGGATAAGLLVYFAPVVALPVLVTWIAIVLLTGYVGLATISAGVASVIFVGIFHLPEQPGLFAFDFATVSLLVFAHRGNIKRMLNGTESRFTRPVWARLTGGK